MNLKEYADQAWKKTCREYGERLRRVAARIQRERRAAAIAVAEAKQ